MGRYLDRCIEQTFVHWLFNLVDVGISWLLIVGVLWIIVFVSNELIRLIYRHTAESHDRIRVVVALWRRGKLKSDKARRIYQEYRNRLK